MSLYVHSLPMIPILQQNELMLVLLNLVQTEVSEVGGVRGVGGQTHLQIAK